MPVARVGVVVGTFPDALALFKAFAPLAFIDFTIKPSVCTEAVGFIFLKLALECIAIFISFRSLTFSLIIFPIAFVGSAWIGY